MNIGIMGLGKIAGRVAKGISFAKDAQLYAVASRDVERAKDFQKEHGAITAYGSYEELVNDPQVHMVYICTPNFLHKEHILLCLKHHKHVICEKPMVLTQAEVKECFAYAKEQQCFLMEAEKTLFTPLNQKLKQLVEDGAIGKITYIEAGYGSFMDFNKIEQDSWLFRHKDSGSFYDIGVYPLCYANFFANSKIADTSIMKRCHASGIDVFAQGVLRYENDVMAYIRSSWDTTLENVGYLYGTKGYIKTRNFWKNKEAYLVKDGKEELIQVEMQSDFTGEIEHAISSVTQGKLESEILGERESLEIAKVLEEIGKCDCEMQEKSVK